jgi:hypothetical protein
MTKRKRTKRQAMNLSLRCSLTFIYKTLDRKLKIKQHCLKSGAPEGCDRKRQIDTPSIQIHERSLPWLDTGISIKSYTHQPAYKQCNTCNLKISWKILPIKQAGRYTICSI